MKPGLVKIRKMRISLLYLLLICSPGFSAFAQNTSLDSLTHQGLSRFYYIHQPPDFDPGLPSPVLILLHGGGGDALSVQNFSQMNPVADAEGFLAIYPEGAGMTGMGFSWADGRGTSADDAGIDDVGFIQRLIDTLRQDYVIDFQRIYLAGFSNGGFMTQRIACQDNRRIAAMASLGSAQDTGLIQQCQPGRPIPMLFINGTADPFVPYEGGSMDGDVPDIISTPDLFLFWQQHNQCTSSIDSMDLPDTDFTDNSTVTQLQVTDCPCNARVRLLRVNNGGHTWPGVENPIYELIAGETNEDIQASQELWDFFQQFTYCDSLITLVDKPAAPGNLQIFPNPAKNWLAIDTPLDLEKLEIFNIQGQRVFFAPVAPIDGRLPLTSIPEGIYWLQARDRHGNLYSARFIKRN